MSSRTLRWGEDYWGYTLIAMHVGFIKKRVHVDLGFVNKATHERFEVMSTHEYFMRLLQMPLEELPLHTNGPLGFLAIGRMKEGN